MGLISKAIDSMINFIIWGSMVYVPNEFYHMVSYEACKAMKQRLLSLTKLTESLTCTKYDKNWNEIKITTGHCAKSRKSKR